jgi:hypothetical protein
MLSQAQKTKPEAASFDMGFLEGHSGQEGTEKAVEELGNTGKEAN